ncbi:MAG TPA: HlyD family efflux transporter periplasmic adaptor subunit, partial [Anaerolineae bacterium]|nr:HlyD family efflux transporter periplasmic adaptor subunit [Anaerolineae bacterium]
MGKQWVILLLVALVLVSCDLGREEPPTPFPTVPPPAAEPSRSGGLGGVIASGEVVAVHEAQLGFTIPGRVQEVNIALGDDVEPGQVLVTLETADQEALVAQAEAAVQTAQANLDLLLADTPPGEIALAETAISAARALVSQAEAAHQGAEAQCAAAQSGIAAAEAALKAAQAQMGQLETGPRAGQIVAAEAELELAKVQLRQAQAAYDRVKDSADIQMRPEALALEQATIAFEAAKGLYEALFEGATADERRAAAAQEEAARVQIVQAQDQALSVCAQVAQASAAVEAAKAQQAQAEQQLSLLKAGPTVEQIAAARAQVAQAEAAVQVARVALDQAELRAPFAGTISALTISPGETVVPGLTVLALTDLVHLQVETTDLSERDVARVVLGQKALVYVEALGEELEGRVVGIAPQATTIGGDIVYTVYVALDEQPPGLRLG